MAAILLMLSAVAAIPAVTDLLGCRLARCAVPPVHPVTAEDRPIEKVSLTSPRWERAGGLLVAELTLSNDNDYAVDNVIIACDFFDAAGKIVGTRGTGIRRSFPPGVTRISGVEFIHFARDLQGGGCRMLSAKAAGDADDME
jgi:hypothetical protein